MQPGIGNWLVKRELLSPDKEAVVDGGRRLSYGQLNRRVNRLANGLLSLGLKPGDRLAMLACNCLEYVEVIMAAAKLGLVLVPLNWRLTASELAYMVGDSGAAALVHDPELAGLAGETLAAAPAPNRLVLGEKAEGGARAYEALLAAQPETEPRPGSPVGLDSAHIIMYTSGTTGRPKGAVLSQRASFYNALNLQLALDFTSADRDLLALPLFHIGGIGLFTLPMLYAGATVVIQRTFDPAVTLRLMGEERITLFFGVPAIFLMLAQQPGFTASALGSLRLVMSGGAPLPVSLIEAYHQAGIVLQQGFGMSEAAPSIATLSRDLALMKAGSIGKPVFHLDARIMNDQGRELPRGEVGELVIRGPNVMEGYWRQPEATAEALREGWFHTGDLARQDLDGDLFIVDRKKDMFISGGENVYPAEVEGAIFELPQVAEAAVVGLADPKWGEVGLAVVALKPGQELGADDLIRHLQGRLAKYKIPKRVAFVAALPRNAAGKVLKNALRQEHAQ